MRRFFAVGALILILCFGFFLSACEDKEQQLNPATPLTVEDCFKDFVTTAYFKSSNKPQGYEDEVYSGEHTSLSELIKSENNLEAGRYSFFQIFTTDKASLIEVSSLSFDVVVSKDCLIQFSISLSENHSLYSDDSVDAKAGVPATITFSNLCKRWTVEDAGDSELREGWMIGKASTYIRIDLISKQDFLQNNYSIQNLKINFDEV